MCCSKLKTQINSQTNHLIDVIYTKTHWKGTIHYKGNTGPKYPYSNSVWPWSLQPNSIKKKTSEHIKLYHKYVQHKTYATWTVHISNIQKVFSCVSLFCFQFALIESGCSGSALCLRCSRCFVNADCELKKDRRATLSQQKRHPVGS